AKRVRSRRSTPASAALEPVPTTTSRKRNSIPSWATCWPRRIDRDSLLITASCRARLFRKSCPILQRRQTRNSFEYFSKRLIIGVPHFHHHLENAFVAIFQRTFCHFYFYPLQIFHRRIPHGFDKPPVEIPPADSQTRCQLFEGYLFGEIFLYIRLCLTNQIIAMVLLRFKNDKRRLHCPVHIDLI